MDHRPQDEFKPLPPRNSRQNSSSLFLLVGLPSLIMLGLGIWFASRFLEPAPPKHITIATGSMSGAYISFGRAYAKILARSGIRLDVRSTRGSVENLRLLAEPGSNVDVALVQGGIATKDQARNLKSVGRIFYEPLWVFYRGKQTITTLTQLARQRIAIGPPGSGTRKLALDLLGASGVSEKNTSLYPLSGAQAGDALAAWRVDAIFVVASPNSALVKKLLKDPNLRLMDFTQAKAYARRFRYLAVLELPRGVIDLVHNVPAKDVQLIAPVAALVVRKSLHSALVSLLAEAAQEVHAGDGLFQNTGDFPKAADPVFTMSADAQRYYKSGKPFLRRYLPFWMVVLFERLIVLIVPVLTILIPLFKIIPLIYRWRIRRRILRWYVKLNDLEIDAELRPQESFANVRMVELNRIDRTAKNLSVPLQYTDELYALREHISLVRGRLDLAASTPGAPRMAPPASTAPV